MIFLNRQRKTILGDNLHCEASRSGPVRDKTQVDITRDDPLFHLDTIRNNDRRLQIRASRLEAREPFRKHIHPCRSGRDSNPFL